MGSRKNIVAHVFDVASIRVQENKVNEANSVSYLKWTPIFSSYLVV